MIRTLARLLPFGFAALVSASCPWDDKDAHHRVSLPDDVQTDPTTLPSDNPTKSFWIDTPGANPLAEYGAQGAFTSNADVCIIGSGITGVSVAYHLSKSATQTMLGRPLEVVVLEARKFCSGATGRNGGHLTPYSFRGFSSALAKHGEREASKAYELESYTAAEVEKIIRDNHLEMSTYFVDGGHNTVFLTAEEASAAQADFDAAKRAGIDVSAVTWITKEEMQEYGASFAGVRSTGRNVWPSKFVTELFKLANSSSSINLSLHTLTPVTDVSRVDLPPGHQWSLETPRGSVECPYVVHATNAYASHLLPQFAGPFGIVPTRGQIIAFRANATLPDLSLASWDGNEGYEYWHPIEYNLDDTSEYNPMVILGGGREVAGASDVADDSTINEQVGDRLKEFLPKVFPTKFDTIVDPFMQWSGIMAFTHPREPLVGPVPTRTGFSEEYKGQYISAGYSGHGMPRAFACAKVIADMVMARITGKGWQEPEWLPQRFLTWNRHLASQEGFLRKQTTLSYHPDDKLHAFPVSHNLTT